MAAAAWFQLRARNMTALGVQVLGTVLNKTVSTGDILWGLPWVELPPSLQVYGIGDIWFGYIVLDFLKQLQAPGSEGPKSDVGSRFQLCGS